MKHLSSFPAGSNLWRPAFRLHCDPPVKDADAADSDKGHPQTGDVLSSCHPLISLCFILPDPANPEGINKRSLEERMLFDDVLGSSRFRDVVHALFSSSYEPNFVSTSETPVVFHFLPSHSDAL